MKRIKIIEKGKEKILIVSTENKEIVKLWLKAYVKKINEKLKIYQSLGLIKGLKREKQSATKKNKRIKELYETRRSLKKGLEEIRKI